MKQLLALALAAVLLSSLSCARNANEQKVADDVTQAVYNNDYASLQQNFDQNTAAQLTRASVGSLSDMMHQLGSYRGITETGNDLVSHVYVFDAKFDKGDMTVRLRLDADGKVAAYRVTPGAPR